MSFKVDTIPFFDKQLKRLAKKFPSLKSDLSELTDLLEIDPLQGISLSNNCYKIRMAIKSKGKGKSGGARIISYLYISKRTVYLITIYDKSEQHSISDSDLLELIRFI